MKKLLYRCITLFFLLAIFTPLGPAYAATFDGYYLKSNYKMGETLTFGGTVQTSEYLKKITVNYDGPTNGTLFSQTISSTTKTFNLSSVGSYTMGSSHFTKTGTYKIKIWVITGNSTKGTMIDEKQFTLSCDHLNHPNDTYIYSTYRDIGDDINHMRLDWYKHSCQDCGAALPNIADKNGEWLEAHSYSSGTCSKCNHTCQHSRHPNDTYIYSTYRDIGDDTNHMRLDWYKHSCQDCGTALPNVADKNGEIPEAHSFQNGKCTKCGRAEPIEETIDLIGSGFEISDNGSIQLGESIKISGSVTANTSISVVDMEIHGPDSEQLGGRFYRKEDFTAGTKSFDLSQAGTIPSGRSANIINKPGTYWLYLYAKTPNMAKGPLLQKKTITVLESAQVDLGILNNGATYQVGESIPVAATASGVKYVQIYYKNINNELDWGQIGPTFTDQSNCTASWSTVGKAPGQYRIKVQGVNIPNTPPLAEDEVIINLAAAELAVINTYPANGASNVPVNSQLTVSFNNRLSYVDVNSSNNVKVTAENGSAISFDRGLGDGTILTIVPWGNLAGNTRYTVTIPTNFLKDAAGNTLPQYTFSFTTGASEQDLDLTIISPKYNETIYQSDINLTWNPVNGVMGYQLTVLDEFNGNIINAMRNEKVTKANYYLEAGKLTSGHRYKVWVGAEVNGQIISQAISYFMYVAAKPAININVPVCEPISTDFEGAAYKFYALMNNKPDKAYILFKKADGSWITVNEIVQNPVMAEKFTLNYHSITAQGLYLYSKDDLVIDVGGEREFKVVAVDENSVQVGESGAGRYYYKRWVQDVQFAPQDSSGNTYRFSARVTSEPDYLVIQFKNVNGDWIPVQTIIDNKNNLEYSKFIMNKSSWEEQTYWRYEKAGVVIEVPGDRVFRITAVMRASDGSYYEDYYSLYEYQLKVAPDQRKPMVKTTDPANNATDVPLDKDIRIYFDNKLRYVDILSQSNVTLTASDGRQVPFDRGLGDGTVLTIIPKDNLDYGTRYTVTIPGNFLKDSYGNTLDQYTLSFITKTASPQTPDGSLSYDRTKALEYAEKYWDRMCADEKFYNTTGYVPIKGSNNFKNKYLNDGYDCAHFVSSALKTGGLDLNYTSCTNLYNAVTDKYGKKTTNKAELEIGDLVFYGSKPFTHVEIITKKITTQKGIELKCASHTTAHFDDRVSSKSPTYVHLYGTKVDKGVTSMLDKGSGRITFEGKDYNVYDQVRANLGLIRNSLNASYQTLSDEQLLKICKAMIQQESNGYAYSSRYEFNHDYANHTKGSYANGSLNRFLDNRHGTIKDWLDKNTVMTKRSFPYRSLINKGELRKNSKTGAYEKHSDYIDPNKNYGNYPAQTIASSSFGMYQIMVDTAIGCAEFKNTGTIQDLYNPGTGTDYFIKVLITKINNAKGDLFLGVRNYNGSGKAAERYAQSVFDKAGVKRLGLSSLSYGPTTEEATDNEAPVYLGASINENGDLVMLEFDEDLIAVDLFDLKSFVTLARDGVNYAELGDFDEIRIDSNNLIIYLDEPLTENHGRIKLAPGTLMDFQENLLTSEVITDYLVADLNPPAYRDVWLNDANNIVTLLFDEDLFSNRELKPGVSISSDGMNFKPLNSNDLVKLNGSSLVLNLEKALPAGRNIIKLGEGLLKDRAGNITTTEVVTEIIVGQDDGNNSTPVNLQLSQEVISLTAGSTQNISVTVSYEDGTSVDVTGSAQYTSYNSGIAIAVGNGIIQAVKAGNTEIIVSYQGMQAILRVSVINEEPPVETWTPWPVEQTVDREKIWTITFNQSVDFASVNDSIFVATDEAGKNEVSGINLSPVPGDAEQVKVMVMPPSDGWQSGTTHYLFISQRVQSSAASGNKVLGKGIRMRFRVDSVAGQSISISPSIIYPGDNTHFKTGETTVSLPTNTVVTEGRRSHEKSGSL